MEPCHFSVAHTWAGILKPADPVRGAGRGNERLHRQEFEACCQGNAVARLGSNLGPKDPPLEVQRVARVKTATRVAARRHTFCHTCKLHGLNRATRATPKFSNIFKKHKKAVVVGWWWWCRAEMFDVFSSTRVALLALKNLNVWQTVFPTCGTCGTCGRKKPSKWYPSVTENLSNRLKPAVC